MDRYSGWSVKGGRLQCAGWMYGCNLIVQVDRSSSFAENTPYRIQTAPPL